MSQIDLVDSTTRSLVLSNHELLLMSSQLHCELEQGLCGDQSDSLKLYPTFVCNLPNGTEQGKYLALDLGGTNFRVLLIYLKGGHQSQVANRSYTISKELMQGSGKSLFDYIASCLYNFMVHQQVNHEKLQLGFTFSFPCKQVGLKKAYLSSWTKGFSCSDTVNQDVCAMLQAALKKYPDIDVEVAAIVNDTTGTLTSCAYTNPNCRVGVIIGTGVNVCYLESDQIVLGGVQMVINTELGAFGSENHCLEPVRNKWDKVIDSYSVNPGQQLFEKMISGMYLGELVRLIVADLIQQGLIFSSQNGKFLEPHSFYSSFLSEVESDDERRLEFTHTREVLRRMGIEKPTETECRCLHLICSRVSQRSAYLISAALVAILRRVNQPSTVIGVDGSVFRHHPHYQHRMHSKMTELSHLIDLQTSFEMMLSEDGSGKGAALVAAVAPHQEVEHSSSSVCTRCQQFYCTLFPASIRYRLCPVLS